MRVTKRKFGEDLDADLTPMIDMTFQLIAFFMVLVNFTQAEQDKRVELPSSGLAKPPEERAEQPLTIQLARVGGDEKSGVFKALVGGDEIEVGPPLEGILGRERRAFGRQGRPAKEVVVIIRAHRDAPTGMVQEVIGICQQNSFERFRLRVKERK
jgi:biopolymer transport protein ExbD